MWRIRNHFVGTRSGSQISVSDPDDPDSEPDLKGTFKVLVPALSKDVDKNQFQRFVNKYNYITFSLGKYENLKVHILSNTYIVKLQHSNLLNVLLGFPDSDPDPAPIEHSPIAVINPH